MEQLLLPVSISEHMVFDSFYPGPNIEIYQSIKIDSQKLLWIAGAKGSGKTHLLQAALHQCFSVSKKGLYISADASFTLLPKDESNFISNL